MPDLTILDKSETRTVEEDRIRRLEEDRKLQETLRNVLPLLEQIKAEREKQLSSSI